MDIRSKVKAILQNSTVGFYRVLFCYLCSSLELDSPF